MIKRLLGLLALVFTAGAMVLMPGQEQDAAANADDHYVQPVYLVPNGARDDRAWVVDRAAKLNQAQWANWGLTFRMAPTVTWRSPIGCEGFLDERDRGNSLRQNFDISDRRIKFLIVGECFQGNGYGGGVCGDNNCWFDNISSMEDRFRANPETGAGSIFAHELGHGFSMPHENCSGEYPGNARDLRDIWGLPDYATNSLMCNASGWGTMEDPSIYWQRDRILYGKFAPEHALGCDHIYECSGGTEPAVADTALTIQPQQIRNGNGKCLDVSGVSRALEARIQVWDCIDGQPNQRFRALPAKINVRNNQGRNGISYELDGYNLRAAHSGWCLDIVGFSPSPGAEVSQYTCGYRDNNVFYVVGDQLKVKSSGLCLAATGSANGTRVTQETCNGSQEQRWSIDVPDRQDPVPLPDPVGTVELRFEHSNKCVDIDGARTGSGANVQQWECVNVPQQRFDVLPLDRGFALRATHSQKCLEVANGGQANGTNIRQWTCDLSAGQQFEWQGASIVSLLSGKCLDVDGGSTANGANVQQWECVDVGQQTFQIPPQPNRAPSVSPVGDRSGTVGDAVNVSVSASDPDGDVLSFTATGLPAGVSIDSSSGVISGSLSAVGSSPVTVTVSDGQLSDSTSFTWTIAAANQAPVLSPVGDRSGTVGDAVNVSVSASDPDGDVLSFTGTGLPSGVSIDSSSGVISGELDAAGSYVVTVSVSDGALSDSDVFTWTVTAPVGFECRVDGNALSWTDQGASRYYIRQVVNGADSYLTRVDNVTSLTLPGNADEYIVRVRVDGVVSDARCPGNPGEPNTFTCQVSDGVLSWTDQGVGSYFIRQVVDGSESFLTRVDNATSLTLTGTADEYVVRARVDGAVTDARCAGNPGDPDPGEFTCQVANGLLSWTDLGVARYNIRQVVDGVESYLVTVEGTTSTFVGEPADAYVVRARVDGSVIDANCPGREMDPEVFVCQVTGGVLSWTDRQQDRYQIRRVVGGVESFLATVEDPADGAIAPTSFDVSGTPADTYIVRYRQDGTIIQTSCTP